MGGGAAMLSRLFGQRSTRFRIALGLASMMVSLVLPDRIIGLQIAKFAWLDQQNGELDEIRHTLEVIKTLCARINLNAA